MGTGKIMNDFVCVCVCVGRPDFIFSPSDITDSETTAFLPPVSSLSHSLSPLSHFLFVRREITVLRQFLGVPSHAHTVGQRFHCHQVGVCTLFLLVFLFVNTFFLTYVCICLCKPATLCRCVYTATISRCHSHKSIIS